MPLEGETPAPVERRPRLSAELAASAARDGSFRRSNPWWLALVYFVIGASYTAAITAASHRALWWAILYGVAMMLLAATIALDGYKFDDAGIHVFTCVRLRRRTFLWREVDYFQVRGWRRGAGFWTVDGRWVRLRAGSWPMQESSASEMSRLELARQIRPT